MWEKILRKLKCRKNILLSDFKDLRHGIGGGFLFIINPKKNNGFCCDWNKKYYKFFGKNIEKTTDDGELRHYEYISAEKMVDD